MWTEQGPFRPLKNLSLTLNEFAWNKIANMVFIEQPCGVGFSYSNKSLDYVTGDKQAAIDNYELIQQFLVRFPQYSTNPLFITSESYGGHYMPTWAKQIVDENTAGIRPHINFKGFAVGNPYTNVFTGNPAGIVTYWGHQVISKPTWDKYNEDCLMPLRANKPYNTLQCTIQESTINNFIDGLLNPYALDYPLSVTQSGKTRPRSSAQVFALRKHLLDAAGVPEELRAKLGLAAYDPCVDNYAEQYLNQLSVKQAIHVDPKITWSECAYNIYYNLTDSNVPMEPYYNYLIDGGYNLNILVYSGDDDAVCATVGTQGYIWDLGYPVTPGTKAWSPYLVNQQTAGFITHFQNPKNLNGLTFATVRNAGHEVPTYKPEIALYVFQNYLNGIL